MADYGPQITVARLFRKESAKGALYFAGRMGMAKIALLKSKDVADDGSEIWHLVMSGAPQRQEQRQRDDAKPAQVAESRRPPVDRYPAPDPNRKPAQADQEIPF